MESMALMREGRLSGQAIRSRVKKKERKTFKQKEYGCGLLKYERESRGKGTQKGLYIPKCGDGSSKERQRYHFGGSP